MQLKLHPDLNDPLKKLCDNPWTTILVLSGSDGSVLDDNFSEFDMWLAAEHGMFLRSTQGEWMTTMPENLHMDWVDSVKFGRLQAKDMHMWTGPISNASVEGVQGGRSVEVQAVGVTKGATIDHILGEIAHHNDVSSPIDYDLCISYFLPKDEEICTFFEPELPAPLARISSASPFNRSTSSPSAQRYKTSCSSILFQPPRKKHAITGTGMELIGGLQCVRKTAVHEGSSVLDLKSENYFSCTVGRKRSSARFLLGSSADVVSLLEELAESLHS